MKRGLVLEGGAMRGMFTAGVLDVLMENNLYCEGFIGVSAGATFGCNYKSKQIGRSIRYNVKYCRDKRYCSVSSLIKTGDMFGKDFCYNEIPFKLDIFDIEAFKNNSMEFYVVCTDVESGKAVYRKYEKSDETDLEYMRGSASMPLVSRIVEVDGHKLLDGGIADSIPLEAFEKMGFEKNIVVLTQPRNYEKGKNKLLPLIKAAMRKYPNFINAARDRHIMYNEQKKYVFKREEMGEALVICPETELPVGRIEKNPDVLKQTYEIGRKTAEKHLSQIRQFWNM